MIVIAMILQHVEVDSDGDLSLNNCISDDQPPDGYMFVRPLGKGSFGNVYLTKTLNCPLFFAVKCATQTCWNPKSQVVGTFNFELAY